MHSQMEREIRSVNSACGLVLEMREWFLDPLKSLEEKRCEFFLVVHTYFKSRGEPINHNNTGGVDPCWAKAFLGVLLGFVKNFLELSCQGQNLDRGVYLASGTQLGL